MFTRMAALEVGVLVLALPCLGQSLPAKSEPGVWLRVYEIGRSMGQVPDLVPGELPNVVKVVSTIDLDVERGDFGVLKENFVSEITGFLRIEAVGPRVLRLISDDGSKLWLDDRLVIDHDGLHGPDAKDGVVELGEGWHALRIVHFQGGGGGHVELRWAEAVGAEKSVLVAAGALRHDGSEPQETAPGQKRIVPALRRGRPGDGAAVAGPHPSFRIGPAPIAPEAELSSWLTDGSLRAIGRAQPKGDKAVVAWLPPSEGGRTPELILKIEAEPYQDQVAVWLGGGEESRRLFLEKTAAGVQGCVFRFAKDAVGRPAATGKATFEMRAVRAMTNGFEIEFTKPLMGDIGWEAESYYCEQWPFDEARGRAPLRDGSVTAVKSASVSADGKKVFLEIEGLKPSAVVYLRLLPPCISEDGELPWSTEAWYTLRAIPEGKAGRVLAAPPRPPQNFLTEEEKKAGWKLLFDGKTTRGWHNWKKAGGIEGWEVVDGCLVRVGSGGDIVTDEEFRDFELSLEWRICAAGNSGIFFRVVEDPKYRWPWETGPEMQVLDNAEHADGRNPLTSAGSNYALHAPVRDVTKPVGLFNKARIVVQGQHVEHWLNDVKVVEYELGSPAWEKLVAESKFNKMPDYGRAPKGRIDLQDHGDKVWYRNIKVRPIGAGG